jgi:hypothetical protein
MAIAFDAAASAKSTSTTVSYTHTVTGSNTLLVVFVTNQNNGGLSSVTIGGNAMTLVDSQSDANITNVYAYYYVGATTGTVEVIRNTATATLYVSSTSYTGCKQSGIPDASSKGANTGSPMTGSVTTVLDNCWTAMGAYGGNGGLTAGTGSTERAIQDGAAGHYDSNGPKTPAGSTSMSVTGANLSNNAAYVIFSFPPLVDSGGGSGRYLSLLSVG